jgi:MFS family permease
MCFYLLSKIYVEFIYRGSAVLTIGAGTLADIFDPRERGTMLGIYYAAPLLGPAIGPIIGGSKLLFDSRYETRGDNAFREVLTQVWSWRATFYFLSALGGVLLLPFLLFKDTFRRERSTSYQAALLRHQQRNLKKLKLTVVPVADSSRVSHETDVGAVAVATALGEANSDPKEIHLSVSDINPFPQLIQVLRRKNNVVMYFPSGIAHPCLERLKKDVIEFV